MDKREILENAGYFSRTVNKSEDPEVDELKSMLNEIAVPLGGTVDKIEVKLGVARIHVKGNDECRKAVSAIFEKMGTTLKPLDPFEVQRERNKKRQERADKMKAAREAKKAK